MPAHDVTNQPRAADGKWESVRGRQVYVRYDGPTLRSPSADVEGPDPAEPSPAVRAGETPRAAMDRIAGELRRADPAMSARAAAVEAARRVTREMYGRPADAPAVTPAPPPSPWVSPDEREAAERAKPRYTVRHDPAASETHPWRVDGPQRRLGKPFAGAFATEAEARAAAAVQDRVSRRQAVEDVGTGRLINEGRELAAARDAAGKKFTTPAYGHAHERRLEAIHGELRRRGERWSERTREQRAADDAATEAIWRSAGLSRAAGFGSRGDSRPVSVRGMTIALARHSYSCVMMPLSKQLAADVLSLAAEIPDADLAEDGRETEPHVTVRYGLHTQRPTKVAAALAGRHGPRLTLGKVSLFEASADRASDVVKVEVDSPDLAALHELLGGLPHTDTHAGYEPHVTLAYVKPGVGRGYVEAFGDRMVGRTDVADRLRFSDQDNLITDLPMPSPIRMGRSASVVSLGRAAGLPDTITLSLTGLAVGTETPALGHDRPREIDGQPVKYVRKRILVAGNIHLPGRSQPVHLSEQDVADVHRYTRQWMAETGGRPFLPTRHTGYDATSNLGWVMGTEATAGGDLYGTLQLIGEDAHRAAARNDVSVQLRRNFRSGRTGKVYPWILEHVAICPDPVLEGLGRFEPLAA